MIGVDVRVGAGVKVIGGEIEDTGIGLLEKAWMLPEMGGMITLRKMDRNGAVTITITTNNLNLIFDFCRSVCSSNPDWFEKWR